MWWRLRGLLTMRYFAKWRTIILVVVMLCCTLVLLRQRNTSTSNDTVKAVSTYLTWPVEIPIPETFILQKLNIDEISDLYFRYVNTLQVFCPVKKVYGGVRSGWYTCDVMRGDNHKSCVSYIIAATDKDVNNAFFEELKQDYKCEKNVILQSTMTAEQISPKSDGMSPVSALKSKEFVDYMAIDIKGGETRLLSWMLTKDLLRNVGQLLINFHGISAESKESVYMEHLQVLKALYTEGFRTFHFARNSQCIFKGNWRRTGCYSLYMMRALWVNGPMEGYKPETIQTQSINDLATFYHRLLVSSQVHCKEVVRIGDVDDGGWDVCNDTEYRPSSPCLVYSFGVAEDWTFEDEVSRIYGCEVHSFDPSIGKEDYSRSDKITFHNFGLWGKPNGQTGTWKMMNLEGIIHMLGHTGKIIDILKMDIEHSEWGALPDILATGVLRNVRQFYIEFHGDPNPNPVFRSKMTTLRGIYDQNFRLFWSHPNIMGENVQRFTPTGRQVSSCYENYYLNTNLKNNKCVC